MNFISLILSIIIKFYQLLISPLTQPSCRYLPTCSCYAMEAIKTHGPFVGLLLSIKRILRCNPFGGSGFDPVKTPINLLTQSSERTKLNVRS